MSETSLGPKCSKIYCSWLQRTPVKGNWVSTRTVKERKDRWYQWWGEEVKCTREEGAFRNKSEAPGNKRKSKPPSLLNKQDSVLVDLMTLKGRRGFEAIQNAVCILNIFFLSLDPWIWKIPWRRAWQPTPVLSSTESHGQRSLVGYSPWGLKELDTWEINTLSLSLSHTHTHTRLLTENNTDKSAGWGGVPRSNVSFATITALTPTKPHTHKYSLSLLPYLVIPLGVNSLNYLHLDWRPLSVWLGLQ